jgi:hypothetical protein
MSDLSIAEELGLLQEAFDRRLTAMGPRLALAARDLPDRLGIRTRRPPLWTRRLSPIVTLYPLLQTESLGGLSRADARVATLAHLFFVVHSFVDDRLLDRQTSLTRAEIVFGREAFAEGELLLLDLYSEARSVLAETRRAQRDYHLAQIHRFGDVEGDRSRARSGLREIVAARARPGRIVITVLLQQLRMPGEIVAQQEAIFDSLAVGLQWEDDLHDWPGDLAAKQDNLVLESLWRTGMSRDEGDAAVVETALVGDGLYAFALGQAREEIGTAVAAHARWGNRHLVACLNEVSERVESFARDLCDEIERSRP